MYQKKILIIEDDEEMIALGKLIFEKEGYQVLSATNGPDGLDMLAETPVDLVLLDIMMNPMDGWQVLERIKSDNRFDRVPVIMLTARHFLEDPNGTKSHAHQFAGYIVKPFVVNNLLHEIQGVLSTRPEE